MKFAIISDHVVYALKSHDSDAWIKEPNPMPVVSICNQYLSLYNMHYNIGQVTDNMNRWDIYNETFVEILLCILHSTNKHAAIIIYKW